MYHSIVSLLILLTCWFSSSNQSELIDNNRPEDIQLLLKNLSFYTRALDVDTQLVEDLKTAFERSQGWRSQTDIDTKLSQPLVLLLSDMLVLHIQGLLGNGGKNVSNLGRLEMYYRTYRPAYLDKMLWRLWIELKERERRVDSLLLLLNLKTIWPWGRGVSLRGSQLDSGVIESIQLGIARNAANLVKEQKRILLMKDFNRIETVSFPKTGSSKTPSHSHNDFLFRSYAPKAYYHLRTIFANNSDNYLASIGSTYDQLHELVSPGGSGSLLYQTHDDKYFLKSIHYVEAAFLTHLLPQYYINYRENPQTLLNKIFDQFAYIGDGLNFSMIILDNVLPTSIKIHQKYDLKGSTYNREASAKEKAKLSPTFKDLDFVRDHEGGFIIQEPAIYDKLVSTLASDVSILESLEVMDYSLLVGVHYLDEEDQTAEQTMSMIDGDELRGAIKAKTGDGKRNVLLFMGIIDFLQFWRPKKELLRTFKTIFRGDDISNLEPSPYAKRFQTFMINSVFRSNTM